MDRQEQQRVLQQLETVIEQSHRLQLELLGLLRSMMEIEPPAPVTSVPEARDTPVDIDLPDKPMFSVEEAAALRERSCTDRTTPHLKPVGDFFRRRA